ncbi:MAG: hypothetical protein PHY30_03495 [Candidatus Pacebacteria bacterium]|nr:hypothetical protein [Candidatus Paceibacterota bacterium]
MLEEFKRMDSLFETSIANEIVGNKNIQIAKTEFRIAGTQQSRKKSGNRCIIAVKKDVKLICVLLVYHKKDLLGKGNETVRWKEIIKEKYREYRELI